MARPVQRIHPRLSRIRTQATCRLRPLDLTPAADGKPRRTGGSADGGCSGRWAARTRKGASMAISDWNRRHEPGRKQHTAVDDERRRGGRLVPAHGGWGRAPLPAPAGPVTSGDRGQIPRDGRVTLATAVGWLPALEGGVRMALSTDWSPSESLNMCEGIKCARRVAKDAGMASSSEALWCVHRQPVQCPPDTCCRAGGGRSRRNQGRPPRRPPPCTPRAAPGIAACAAPPARRRS